MTHEHEGSLALILRLPAGWRPRPQGKVHWTTPLLSRLSATVKLVGPTISCEGSPLNGDMQGKWRRNPHVQSYVVATDQVRVRHACLHELSVRAQHPTSSWCCRSHPSLGLLLLLQQPQNHSVCARRMQRTLASAALPV